MSRKSNPDRVTQILEAAGVVFAQTGLEATRMDDIAAAAGVSKGALYLYFKNKDALIIALGEQIFSRELAGYREALNVSGSIRERLQALTRAVVSDLDRFRQLQPLLYEFFALSQRYPQARQILQTFFDQSVGILKQVVEDGIARGEIRAADPVQAALALGAQVDGILLWQPYHPATVDLEAQINFGFELVLKALQ
ncbi:MAG: TetR/AcrR family transcriptional regulator [Anaerolineae bacterium]